MLTQNLPEGSMSLHGSFSHEGSSAKHSYNTHNTTTKGCGMIINCHLCRARQFFPAFL